MGSVGKFMSVLSTKAHEKAQTELDKAEQSKKSEIEVWKKVLDDPASTAEQRQKAVDSLNKLYNWKGKGDSPFSKLAGFMQHLGQKQGGQPPDSKTGTPPFVETQPGQGKPGASAQPVPAGKPGGNVFQKVGSGIGKGMGAIDSMLNQHPRELPPLDASAFPTGAQQREAKTAEMKAELEAKWPYEEKRIRLQEELRTKTAAAKARNAMSAKEKYPGEAMINALPQDQRQGLLDANGVPVDPNGLYGPATGDTIGIARDEDGKPYLSAIRVGTGPARIGTSQQTVYDPLTNSFKKETFTRTTGTPEPPKQGEERQHPRTLPSLKESKTTGGKAEARSTSNVGGRARGVIPLRAFVPLQKQSNAISEARNSLVGDTPGEVGGMARDIEIFKNPESVDRVGKYIKFVNSQLEESGRAASSMGPMVAMEWYAGLPGAISNLQQEATAQYSKDLDAGAPDGPEHQFVADYYRLLGTWGGMRAATGASAARWSFRNLISEMPTPGPVTSYPEAKRRILNMANESNVVAKSNPMVEKIDTNIYDKKKTEVRDEQTFKTQDNRIVVHRKGKYYYKDTGQEYVEPK